MTILNDRVKILTGDITGLNVDAVVNAANSSLLGGGGVDGAIHRAAGPSLLEECRGIRREQWPDGMPAGEAVMTGAGRMACRHVIHTVGPVWQGGVSGEPETLASAYRNSLNLAAEHHLESIAFPAISTGVYGYPPDAAARVVYRVLKEFTAAHSSPEEIVLIFFSSPGLEAFVRNIPEEDQKEI